LHVRVLCLAGVALLRVKLLTLFRLCLNLGLMLCKQQLLLLVGELFVTVGRRVYVGRDLPDGVLVLLLRVLPQRLVIWGN
jgi:hypothetical protein